MLKLDRLRILFDCGGRFYHVTCFDCVSNSACRNTITIIEGRVCAKLLFGIALASTSHLVVMRLVPLRVMGAISTGRQNSAMARLIFSCIVFLLRMGTLSSLIRAVLASFPFGGRIGIS